MPTEIAVCRGTVERVTTVLVTAMVLVAVMFVVVVLSLALAARGHRRRQLDDARAEARHWVERLGGELLVLDGAAVRLGTGAAAGLAEAAERFTAAGVELGAARTPRQCRIAQDTAVEGLHHVRIARSPASTGVPTASATRCSRSTDCSWRAWPKLNSRNSVPRVEGASSRRRSAFERAARPVQPVPGRRRGTRPGVFGPSARWLCVPDRRSTRRNAGGACPRPRVHRFPYRRQAAEHSAMHAPLPEIRDRTQGQRDPAMHPMRPLRRPGTPNAQFAADPSQRSLPPTRRVPMYPRCVLLNNLTSSRGCSLPRPWWSVSSRRRSPPRHGRSRLRRALGRAGL